MTDERMPPTPESPEPGGVSSRTPLSPTRRAALGAATWAVPAIAVAATAPVAAASDAPVVSFEESVYSGAACSALPGITLVVRVNGIPAAGRSVTVSLSGSYAFPGGSPSFTGVSGTDGRLTLPAISLPSVGGLANLTATIAGGETISTTVSVYNLIGSSADFARFPAPPAGVSAVSIVGDEWNTPETVVFLGSDGELYESKNGGSWTKLPSGGGVKILKNQFDVNRAFFSSSTVYGLATASPSSYPLPTGPEVVSCEAMSGAFNVLDRAGDVFQLSSSGIWQLRASGVKALVASSSTTVICVGETQLRSVNATGVLTAYPDLPVGVSISQVGAGVANGGAIMTYVKAADSALYWSNGFGAWAQVGTVPVDFLYVHPSGDGYWTVGSAIYRQTTTGFRRQLPSLPAGLTVSGMGLGYNGKVTTLTAKASDGYLYQSTYFKDAYSEWVRASPYGVDTFYVSRYGRAYYALKPGC